MTTTEIWRGHINRFIPPNKFAGWAIDLQDTDNGCLEATVRLHGQPIGHGKADLFNADLRAFGSGNFGFEIICQVPVRFASILAGDVDIAISKDDVPYGVLPIDRTLQLFVEMLEVSRLIREFSAFEPGLLRNTLFNTQAHFPGPAGSALAALLTLVKNSADPVPTTTASFDDTLISPVYLKTGIVCSDQSAMLGRDGHLFLIEGSNRVMALFTRPHGNDTSAGIAGAWIDLIKSRCRIVRDLGPHFLQIVIPDKVSVTRELLDGTMSYPTATLTAFEDRAARELPAGCYLSGLSVISRMPFGTAFRKVDTHFTPEGAFAVFAEICAMLGSHVPRNIVFDVPYITSGDLAQRFFGYALHEVLHAARDPAFAAGRRLVSEIHPPPGRHVGLRQVFTNALAPIRKKVLVFGNSFFQGHVLQGSLNYWMSIWFAEYHFVAAADMDVDTIKDVQPDIVICQTIERFMEVLPQD